MTTASKNTDPSRRSSPSRAEFEKIAPTLLRLPDLHPPTDAGEGCAEEDLPSVEHDESTSPVMQDLLDAATQTTPDTVNHASVTRLPDLAPAAAPVASPVLPPTVAVEEPVVAAVKPVESFAATQPSSPPRHASADTNKASASAETGRDGSWKATSESLGNRALALAGSRNTLLALLALIACWAVFAPRRHPNAQQNSEVLSAKEPAVDETASKLEAKSSFDSVASTNKTSQRKPSRSISDSATKVAAAEATALAPKPTPSKSDSYKTGAPIAGASKFGGSNSGGLEGPAGDMPGLNAPAHSMSQTKLGQPTRAGEFGSVPEGTSLVESQLASSATQRGMGGVPPFDSAPFHSEPVAESFAPVVREPQVAMTPSNPGLTSPVSEANSELGLPANDRVPSGNRDEPVNAVSPAVPAPLQTGTPGLITNWIDYLPPMPSELGEQASVNEEQSASPEAFPTTQSPLTPDFQFGLPGDGPEVSVGNQVPSSGGQPEARVATPSFFPESNLRR
ncbi:hypothetical protein [Rhodopirellula sp. P2]|uniref:hypothetical protein n=1 Tax=Rhodopirellula sp. P2 TaxID=2127060 RepID=UPI0023681017|nr:hypothetical protein [Rhodopirellula sp. P2]WDQ18831.1 hypothetical protein PSR62_09870 [Rhodopirellula sp. P2]